MRGETYTSVHINLTGVDVSDCTFVHCAVSLWLNGADTSVERCRFVDCDLLGDGWLVPVVSVELADEVRETSTPATAPETPATDQ